MKSKITRRAEALERQQIRERRTAKEQLTILDKRPGEAKRERAKLKS